MRQVDEMVRVEMREESWKCVCGVSRDGGGGGGELMRRKQKGREAGRDGSSTGSQQPSF